MSKIYKSLVSTIFYSVALIAIVYALVVGFTVPVWAIVVFFLAVLFVTAIRTYGTPIKVKYFVPDL
jgi:hypothetical protein